MKLQPAIYTCLFLLLSSACHRHHITQINTTYAAPVTNARGDTLLLGNNNRQQLEQPPFSAWFAKNYTDYTVDSAMVTSLKPLLENKHFIIFMGTWCGDSRREVPRMYKLLDYCGIKPRQVTLINVYNEDSVYKQSPTHEERGLLIHRVPDLLVYDDKKEMGRIVEAPVASLEKDLLAIVQGEKYVPKYKAVPYLASLFRSTGVAAIRKDLPQTAILLKELVLNRGELHAYGKMLMAEDKTAEALVAFELNTLLFPQDPVAWNALGNAWLKKADREQAIAAYKQQLALQPDNTEVQKRLNQLGGQ